MNKWQLLAVAIVATLYVVMLQQSQAAGLSQLDGWKTQFLPPEFRNTNFTIDDIKKVYRAKCKKASGVDNSTLYQEIEKSANTLLGCLSSLTNFSAIQEEIETARPIGELDTVFHKYCTKVPEVKRCIVEFNTKLQPCLTAEERNQNSIFVRVSTNLMGFMCAKGGDQIALFVAEEGPECMEANQEAISQCFNASFAEFIPENATMPDIYNLPELVLAPEHCVDLERFEACTLHHLQQCREITPANVAESVFRFVKNETNCRRWLAGKASERPILKEARSGAEVHRVMGASLFLGSAVLLFLLQMRQHLSYIL